MDPHAVIPSFGLDRCSEFLEGTREAPPRGQLLEALRHAPGQPRGRALDIGCGPGKEVVVLLRAGFEVTGIDPYPTMIAHASARVRAECPEQLSRLTLTCARIEDQLATLRPSAFTLVHAGFVLPFVAARDFAATFYALREAIAPGGIFVGQLFGPDDEFIRTSPEGSMSCQTAGEVTDLLAGLEILGREEVNRSGFIGKGRAKWWHVHHIVARKPLHPQG